MIQIGEYLAPERVTDLRSRTKEAALLELVETLRGVPEIKDPELVLDAVREREKVLSTGIGLGVAVPHAKFPGLNEFVLAYGRSREGIETNTVQPRRPGTRTVPLLRQKYGVSLCETRVCDIDTGWVCRVGRIVSVRLIAAL